MTDPSITTRTPGANNTAALSHTVSKPAGSGGSGLVCFTFDTATAVASTASSGWQLLDQQHQGTTTNHSGAVFYAANLDTAATLVVDLTQSQEATWVAFRIADVAATPQVASTNGSGTPYTFTALSSLASGNCLSILYVGMDSSTTTTQTVTFPTGWGNQQSQNPSITSSAATFTADQMLTGVTSITPANFTPGSAEQWVTFNIAIPGPVTADTVQFFLSSA